MSQEGSSKAPSGAKPASAKKGNNWLIAIIVIVIVVIAGAGGGYYYYVSTKKTVTTIDFYTWWASTGKVGMQHLFPVFQQKYPYYRVTTTLSPGAAGSTAKYAILTLIEAGKPPNTFQVHFGPEMLSYIEIAPQGAADFVNMTPIAKSMGLLSPSVVFPQVLEAGSFNGSLYSLPANVHRSSLLYFNPQTLKKYDLPIPTTVAQLLYDSKVLYQHGIYWAIPGADSGYDQSCLWESLLLAYGGPRVVDEFNYGVLSTSNPAYVNATETFTQLEKYNYPGASSMSWTEMIPYLVDGETSFQVDVSSFVNYAYDYLNITTYPAEAPYTSWSNVTLMQMPFSGTSDYYDLIIDSLSVPIGATQKGGLILSEFWSSYQGQQVWTKWKAVTFYENATDWYNTPAQWADYQALKTTSNNDFTYAPSDGGMFDDAYATATTAFTTLAETKSVSSFNALLSQAISEEYSDWMAAAKLHMGFMGFPGEPLGGYYPPWVTAP
ncbi:MAG: glucose ABC transporter substrate-binding protein GlcS [Thermoprotei archaeon]